MKKISIFFLCMIAYCATAFSQSSLTPFSCSSVAPTYVIGFKNGTNCTPAPFNVYTTSINGTLSSTPLFSTPDTIEINGIGVNAVDNKGYALSFRRTGTATSCANDTVKLIRFGANGATETLGYIPQPAGTIVNTALGAIGANGNYYFGAIFNGQFAVGTIANTGSLSSGTGPLTATYRTVALDCQGRNFSDWAFKPSTNTLFTYGISVNNTGLVTGTVMSLDLTASSLSLSCVAGTETTGTFTNPADDNFGGIMFGTDGNMYGVNVDNRRYYRINTVTGALTLVSTIPANGSGIVLTRVSAPVTELIL